MMCIIRLFFIALSAMATLLAGSVSGSPACVQVVIPTAGGAFAQTGQRLDGYLLAGNTSVDYFGGGPKEYRNWFVFRVPTFAGPLVGAEFRLHAGTTISDSGSEMWEVHHVASGITNFLQPLPMPAPGVFADLADGPLYGRAVISSNQNSRVYYDPGAPVLISLTGEALAALTAAQGNYFTIGGVVTSQDGDTNTPDLVFFNTNLGVWPIELVLNFGPGEPAASASFRSGVTTQWPDSTEILFGDSMEIVGRVCGQPPLALQWLFNGQPLAGEQGSVLYRSFLSPTENGAYQLWASNASGASTSPPVSVAAQALKIYTDLVPRTVLEGEAIGFSVSVATLLPTTYEWRKDGTLLIGQNYWYLNTPATAADAGNYQMVARNTYGSITSAVARLTVQLAPPVLTWDVQDVVVGGGMTFILSVGATGHQPISYQWYHNGVAIPGEIGAYLNRPSAQYSDAGNYSVTLSNVAGRVNSRVAKVTVQPFSQISGPWNVEAYWGSATALGVGAIGSSPQTFEWYHNGLLVPNATNSYIQFTYVLPSDAGPYFVVAANPYGSMTSMVATLTVRQSPPFVGIHLERYEATPDGLPHLVAGTRATLAGDVTAGPPASLQWQRNGVNIPGATNQILDITALTVANSGTYVLVATNIFGSGVSSPIEIDVVPTPPSVEIRIAEYDHSPSLTFPQLAAGTHALFAASTQGSPPLSLQWRRNGKALPGETQVTLLLPELTPEDTGSYTLRVSNPYGAVTSAAITIQVVMEPPYFALVPKVTKATVGIATALRSLAGGSPPLSYQWQWQGANLPGETNNVLLLKAGSTNASGEYRIVVRNSAGAISVTNTVAVRAQDALDRWNWSLPEPQGSRLKSIAWGNGRSVAMGRAGNVLVSTNGTDWKSVLIPADVQLGRVIWGNDQFAAFGYVYAPVDFTQDSGSVPVGFYGISGVVFTSPDGEHWTKGDTLTEDLFADVAYGNGIYVACGSVSRVWTYTSVDGRTWTPRHNVPGNAYQVEWGNGMFFAAGGSGPYTSSNGLDWVPTTIPGYGFNEVTFGNGVFIGLSSTNDGVQSFATISTSPDAANWGNRYLLTNFQYVLRLAAGNGSYVALAPQQYFDEQKGRVATSSDLQTWTVIDTDAGQELESVGYHDGQFVVVGEAGTVVQSTDGLSWFRLPVANDIDYYGLASNGRRLVAAGDDGTILTSDDGGDNWTVQSTPNSRNLHGAAYGNGLFVATGRRGLILTSPNGVNWTRREAGVTNYLERVHYANNRWVAVGEGGDISTSVNGTQWTTLNTGYPFSDHEGITYGLGKWMAAGGYFDYDEDDGFFAVGTLYSSPDGQTWTRVPFSTGKRLRDITFAEGRFVAVGNDRLIVTSNDGGPWQEYVLPQEREGDNFRRVIYAQGWWIVVGNDGRMISTRDPSNRESWREHVSHTSQNLHDIIPTPDGGFVTLGNNGMILRSTNPDLRIVSVQVVAGGLEFYFASGGTTGPIQLQGSSDLQSWETIATDVSSPYVLPAPAANSFYRLVSP